MKLTSIVGPALLSVFLVASTAKANEIAFNGKDFHALTSAKQACLQYNDTGWMYYNYSAGTCASPMTVISSAMHVDNATTGTQSCYVDGSCPSGYSATCTLKTISKDTGAVVGTPSTYTSSPGSTFDMPLSQPFSDIGTRNYEVFVCSLQPGCRIWGAGCSSS